VLVEEDDEDDQEESRDGAQESQKGKSFELKDAAVADPAEKQKESPKNKKDPEVKSTARIS